MLKKFDTAPRVFTKKEASEIVNSVLSHVDDSGTIKIAVSSWWGCGQRWARNATSMSSDQREVTIIVERLKNGGRGIAETNQVDAESIKGVVGLAEYYAEMNKSNSPLDRYMSRPKWNPVGLQVWSDKTYDANILEPAAAIERITKRAADESLMSAGYMSIYASTALVYSRNGSWQTDEEWGEITGAGCSMTIRHPKGLGSGWAEGRSFDITKINLDSIASIALEKCKASLNPVRIEPGRYVTILEPNAVAELFKLVVRALNRRRPEHGNDDNPIFGGYDSDITRFVTTLGRKMVDERINLYHDPEDPLVGTHRANMVSKVNMITKGVLTAVFNDYDHEVVEKYDIAPNVFRTSFRVDGTDTTTEEIIKNTKRGLLVSRFTGVSILDSRSLLATGLTRDGIWLVENGKITQAVRNFRWIESPLFVFNNVEQIGVEELVSPVGYSRGPLVGGIPNAEFQDANQNMVVPTMKVRDFNFSSLIDAI